MIWPLVWTIGWMRSYPATTSVGMERRLYSVMDYPLHNTQPTWPTLLFASLYTTDGLVWIAIQTDWSCQNCQNCGVVLLCIRYGIPCVQWHQSRMEISWYPVWLPNRLTPTERWFGWFLSLGVFIIFHPALLGIFVLVFVPSCLNLWPWASSESF